MISPQFSLSLHHELAIDNFAGGGGASTGIERALGRPVDHAINHDLNALGMHRINHPQTIHHREDVFEVDPLSLTEGRPVGMAWFSPDCRHFSKAKGGKPVEKRIRGLCLVMLRYAKIKSQVMFMENVEEIQTWGPLVQMVKKGVQGWYPDPQHKGRTWRAFLDILQGGIAPDHPDLPEILEVLGGTITQAECVRGFGYRCEHRELRACDYGAPTIRKRLFMIARRDGKPIVWPAPTHADPKKINPGSKLKPWRTIGECIDWQLPCPSIFLEGAAARAVRCKRPLAKPTLRRIAKGIDRYVLKSTRPFLVSLTHRGGERVESVDAPANTITGANRGEKEVVTPFITEHANASKQRNMPADGPMRTQCGGVKGGHFALVAGSVVNTTNGKFDDAPSRAINPESTLPTVTGEQKFAAVMAQHNGGFNATPAHPVDEPVSTINSSGSQQQLITASCASYFGTEKDGQSADEPARTITAKARTCLVEQTSVSHLTPEQLAGAYRVATFLREYGVEFEGEFATVAGHVMVDIGMRMLTPRELFRAQGFPEDYVINQAWQIHPFTGALTEVRLPKSEQIKKCGNSVCPPVAEAIVRANVPDMCLHMPGNHRQPSSTTANNRKRRAAATI